MSRTSKIIMTLGALGVVGAVSFAGIAYAHGWRDGGGYGMGRHMGGYMGGHMGQCGGGYGMHRGGDHDAGWRHRGGGGGAMMNRFAARYDTNKDGKITQEEIDANRTEWFNEADANKDGKLSLDEFQDLWLKAMRTRMVRAFQRLDPDGDATLTIEEYKAPLEGIVSRMDRNGDNALSRDDHRGRGKHGWARRGDCSGPGMGWGRQGMGPGMMNPGMGRGGQGMGPGMMDNDDNDATGGAQN